MGRAYLPTIEKKKRQWRTVALVRGGLYLLGLFFWFGLYAGICRGSCVCGLCVCVDKVYFLVGHYTILIKILLVKWKTKKSL